MKKRVIIILIILLVVIVIGVIYFNNRDKVKDVECYLVPDSGTCEAAIPRYYFDSTEDNCKQFNWGGCGGVVLFDTIEECQDSCE